MKKKLLNWLQRWGLIEDKPSLKPHRYPREELSSILETDDIIECRAICPGILDYYVNGIRVVTIVCPTSDYSVFIKNEEMALKPFVTKKAPACPQSKT